METDPPPRSLPFVFWAIWGAFLAGIFVIYFVIGKSVPVRPAHEPTFWQVALLPALISGALRWSFLPSVKAGSIALVVLALGVALAEMTCFIGMFVFPSHKGMLFGVSVLAILQFVPVYAGRFGKSDLGE